MGQSKLRRKAARGGRKSGGFGVREEAMFPPPAEVLNQFMDFAHVGGGVYPIGGTDLVPLSPAPASPPSGRPVCYGTLRLFHIFGQIDAVAHPLANLLLLIDIDGRPIFALPGMAWVAIMTDVPDRFGEAGPAVLAAADRLLEFHSADTACPICRGPQSGKGN